MPKPLQKLTTQEREELSATIDRLARISAAPRTSAYVEEGVKVEAPRGPAAFYGRQVEEETTLQNAEQVANKFGLDEKFFNYFEVESKN